MWPRGAVLKRNLHSKHTTSIYMVYGRGAEIAKVSKYVLFLPSTNI